MKIFPKEKRIGRSYYILLQLLVQFLGWSLVGLLIMFLEEHFFWSTQTPLNSPQLLSLLGLGTGSLFLIFHQIFITFKRWHDIGKSGANAFTLLIPIKVHLLQLCIIGYLCLKKGDHESNRFGPKPSL